MVKKSLHSLANLMVVIVWALTIASFVHYLAADSVWVWPMFILCAVWTWLVLKDTMNKVQGIGPLFWLARNTAKPGDHMFSTMFLRETDYPWRVGHGVQFRFNTHYYAIGLCRRQRGVTSINEGLLHAVGGHNMDTDVDEISTWP